MNSNDFDVKVIDHLGIVSGMCKELDLVNLIDSKIPQSFNVRKVSVGQAVLAMILIGLGFTQRRLYLVSDFLQNKPIDLLIDKSLVASDFNDDVLGRALDALYNANVNSLFSDISANICHKLGIETKFAHLDSTSIHVDGQYNSDSEEDVSTITITNGYSRDHRQELNQIVLNLIVENKSKIPLAMKAADGNSSDKKEFALIIDEFSKQLINYHGVQYFVADSALYSSTGIQNISEKVKWITRVPETLSEAKNLINNVDQAQMKELNENYKYSAYTSKYANVEQRWLLIFSKQAQKRELITLNKQMQKTGEKETALFNSLCDKEFACEPDAKKALKAFEKSLKIIQIKDISFFKIEKYTKKGRPKTGEKGEISYIKIQGYASTSIEKRNQLSKSKGVFILATNEIDKSILSDEEVFYAYKNQGQVESGFRFLKDPQFLASTIFIKNPERVEALMMVMTLCLAVYSALEYKARNLLKEKGLTFPDQKGKPINNPTMRWAFACFKDVVILYINSDKQQIVKNLQEKHIPILKALGENYEKYYL